MLTKYRNTTKLESTKPSNGINCDGNGHEQTLLYQCGSSLGLPLFDKGGN